MCIRDRFTYMCLHNSKRAQYISESLYLRRIRGNSIMTGKTSFDNFYGYLKCCIEMHKHLDYFAQPEDVGVKVLNETIRSAKYVLNSLSNSEKEKLHELCFIDSLYCVFFLNFLPGKFADIKVCVSGSDLQINLSIESLKSQLLNECCVVVESVPEYVSDKIVLVELMNGCVLKSNSLCLALIYMFENNISRLEILDDVLPIMDVVLANPYNSEKICVDCKLFNMCSKLSV